mmetsp:Transcript_7964/g.18450  ORF Transcript_7964/g.18450 Transcript_7964/m.18450 type:complete len:597 (-) Transcript_7964:390-2180(-)
MSSCQCPPNGCCVDPDLAEKKGPPVFAKQIGPFADDEEPLAASVLTVQQQWYRPRLEKQQPEADERLKRQLADSPTFTFWNVDAGRSGLLEQLEASRSQGRLGLDVPEFERSLDVERLNQLVLELQRVKKEASRRRWIVRVPMLTSGCIISAGAIALLVFLLLNPEESASISFLLISGFVLCTNFGTILLLLSILPSDRRIQHCVRLFLGLVTLPAGAAVAYMGASGCLDALNEISCTYGGLSLDVPCWAAAAAGGGDLAVGLVILCLAFCILIDQTCDPALDSLRLLSRVFAAAGGVWVVIGLLSFVLKNSLLLYAGGPLLHIAGIAVGILLALLGWIFSRPRFRVVVQLWLTKWAAGTSRSGVNELLGGRKVDEVVSAGQGRFRGVLADKVLLEHFESLPDMSWHQQRELYKLSEPVPFGSVDAFISYSWKDSPLATYVAIQTWRASFHEVHGREPLLWIDRFCQPRQSEQNAAMMMPVCIAGCKRFLSLSGDQYLQSLCNLVELFVFTKLGRPPEEYQLILTQAETPGVFQGWIDTLDVWSLNDASDVLLRAREAGSVRNEFQKTVTSLLHNGIKTVKPGASTSLLLAGDVTF